jgi:hypothetical protein
MSVEIMFASLQAESELSPPIAFQFLSTFHPDCNLTTDHIMLSSVSVRPHKERQDTLDLGTLSLELFSYAQHLLEKILF